MCNRHSDHSPRAYSNGNGKYRPACMCGWTGYGNKTVQEALDAICPNSPEKQEHDMYLRLKAKFENKGD